jgi:hypothetical protein
LTAYRQRLALWVAHPVWATFTSAIIVGFIVAAVQTPERVRLLFLWLGLLELGTTVLVPVGWGRPETDGATDVANRIIFREALRHRRPTYIRAAASGALIGFAASVQSQLWQGALCATLALAAAAISFDAGLRLPQKKRRGKKS